MSKVWLWTKNLVRLAARFRLIKGMSRPLRFVPAQAAQEEEFGQRVGEARLFGAPKDDRRLGRRESGCPDEFGGLQTAGFSGVEKYVFGWPFSGGRAHLQGAVGEAAGVPGCPWKEHLRQVSRHLSGARWPT